MPPDPSFIEGTGISISASGGGGSISFNWNNDPYYGYRDWYGGSYDDRRFASNWVFVDYGLWESTITAATPFATQAAS